MCVNVCVSAPVATPNICKVIKQLPVYLRPFILDIDWKIAADIAKVFPLQLS